MSTERHATSPSASPEDNSMFIDILHEAPLFGHRKSRSLFGSIFYFLILASYAVLAAAAPWIFSPIQGLIPILLCSCDVLLLIVTGTAAMLLVMAWRPHIGILSISALLRIIMLIEAICAGSFMSAYIGYVHQYNSLDSQPDVLKSLYSPLQPSSSLEGLRYNDGGRLSDQQMALLQYQRENLHFLSEEILQLQECLSKYERSGDGSTPQVDLAHLLAARDQELRTLSAEMNQLQSELRLARSLIAERDSEVQRVRNTNNQYVEENERLRAILAEWSTRAAKLERALEVERMSNLDLQKKISALKNQSQVSPDQS
ncbi:protein FIP1-like isoform X3 [Tripterygium wilfordii]|uniref:protein FIP1-like isoform X3 n=1 Tax=Tripterygium wilfordii TaxID=458696 RepID=UPI0018F82286|nr:protein FIP1-like isoform X3 [Tripterygium wilfordii]